MLNPRAISGLPDVFLRTDGFPVERRPRLIATGYGGSVRASFSGSSAYLAEAGIENGSLDGAFTLYATEKPDRVLQLKGALWKAQRLLRHEAIGGFKFSEAFSAHLWRRYLPSLAGTDVISNFQFFSDRFLRQRESNGIGMYFYLDATLHDYLEGYKDFDVAGVDPSSAERVFSLERDGYQRADGIAVMSTQAANTLTSHYGVAPERVNLVLPGANMTDEMAERVLEARATREDTGECVVGFIGVYPERKGLPKLASAISALRRQGVPVRLLVVGRCPADIAAMDGVEAVGFISKSAEPDAFIAALSRMDLGCLLSVAEMSGIAVLEFIRCGIPVLATAVGGIPDNLRGGGGISVPGDASVTDIAAAIGRFIGDGEERRRLESEALKRSSFVRWQYAAAALGEMVTRGGSR
ncbi:glycosyltransferase involved in cell wall biosynthesis [Geodermatophilus tzadiensis]|uniref:Glycosyltransferase involved in cell wall biosynthesis n=1 Tax=Geodermatophilus tzadiensis TaxID=1137988 RepID=A0A2T0TRJ5_9ACTN|nr:glycosyltransferase family 4 protein [Geodermatophilus tzadiensis]PRY48138.1 glycosyltransferase involved in cell wall biosynthesis [Geodermatophilus tzadiensis]